jgi:hypothetical protein
MRKIAFLLFIMSVTIFWVGCSKDDNNPEPNPEIKTTISKTIGLSGGEIELGDLKLDFQAGTFDEEYEITISEFSNYVSKFDIVNSKAYKVEGLPQVINNAIAVSLKHNGVLVDESYLAMGEELFIKSLNAETIAYRMLDATDIDGKLVGEIPILEPEPGLKANNTSPRNGETLGFNILAVSGYGSYKSEQQHFKIKFPKAYIEDAYAIADYLEDAYTKIAGLGFSYQNRTNWPVEVLVKPLEAGVYGYSTNSLWGDNYGWIEMNSSLLSNAEEVKVTAGHEFFHLVQSLYDPRNRFSKSKFQSPHLWLDEATAVWAEQLFIGNTDYVSEIFGINAKSAIQGANTINTDAQSYGYGMAAFIKHLTEKNGNSILPAIYNEIANGSEAFTAINKNLSTNTSLIWNNFVKEFLSFNLYKGAGFTPGWIAGNADGVFTIATAQDTVKKFKLKYPDISAKIFYLKTNYTDFSDDTQITFETLDGTSNNQIMVYKFNANKSEYITQGHDTLKIEGIKSILDDGYKIAAVVTNDNLSSPYTNEQEVELKISIKEKFNFDYATFEIKGTGTFEDKSGDSTKIVTSAATFVFNDDAVATNQNVIINGKYISITGNYTQYDWHNSYTMNVTVDNEFYPTQITSFSGTYTLSYTDSNTNRVHTTTVSGNDVPLVSNFGNNHNFAVYSNIDGNISDFSFQSTDYFGVYSPPITSTRTLLSFDGSNGRISFNFNKND